MRNRYLVRCIGEAAKDWKLLLCLMMVDFEELVLLREKEPVMWNRCEVEMAEDPWFSRVIQCVNGMQVKCVVWKKQTKLESAPSS